MEAAELTAPVTADRPAPAASAPAAMPAGPPAAPPAIRPTDFIDRTIDPGRDIPKYSVLSHASNVPACPSIDGTRVASRRMRVR